MSAFGTEILHVQVAREHDTAVPHFASPVNRQIVDAFAVHPEEVALHEITSPIKDKYDITCAEAILVAKATWPGTLATPPPS